MHDMPLRRGQAAADTLGSVVPTAELFSSAYFTECSPWPGDGEALTSYSQNSIAEFYAHALMAGAQATAAYETFSEVLETRGEDVVAALFRKLAGAEMERASELFCRTASLPMPQLARWQHSWLFSAAPEQAARDLVAHLITPRTALTISLDAVGRARLLYERLSSTAGYSEVRAQARVLAGEKSQHARWLGDTLAIVPAPLAWSEEFAIPWLACGP